MKLNKITKVVLYFILLIILLYLVPAVVLRLQRKAPYIDGYTDAITRVRGESGADSIIMDFSKCSRGNNLLYYGMGSTGFTFEGIKNGNCIYYYGAEIENPSGIWGMQYKCKVPASTGRKTFKVGNIGIEMEELNQYCTKL